MKQRLELSLFGNSKNFFNSWIQEKEKIEVTTEHWKKMFFFRIRIPTLYSICLIFNYYKTRTKTSIRYAKENDREKRERRRERERKVEGEI